MTTATRSPAIRLFEHTRHVVGQEEARKLLAVILRRQALQLPTEHGVLVAGKTGVGKTITIRDMCAQLDLPFAETNATSFTDRGYVGLDLPQMFLPLISSAARMIEARRKGFTYRYDANAPSGLLGKDPDLLTAAIKLAEGGVVLFDEFDKLLVVTADATGRNVGKKLQAELLKIIEGSVVYVSDRESSIGLEFDTGKTLIICAGAFVGLDDVIKRRLGMENTAYTDESLWELTEPKDFVSMGILPELAGRLAAHVMFKPLREDHLAQILQQERGLLDEYTARFAAEGVEFVPTDAGLRTVAAIALQRETGARGLRHLLEKICGPALYQAAEKQQGTAVLDVTAANALRMNVVG